MTEELEGEYFVYCDQDDRWLPEKLEILQEALEGEKARLACSEWMAMLILVLFPQLLQRFASLESIFDPMNALF